MCKLAQNIHRKLIFFITELENEPICALGHTMLLIFDWVDPNAGCTFKKIIGFFKVENWLSDSLDFGLSSIFRNI